MDLTAFTNKKPEEKMQEKRETILNNDLVKVEQVGEYIEFEIKDEKGFEKYQDFLFFSPTDSIITDSDEVAQKYFQKSLDRGVEGLMFKSLNADYVPGLRVGSMAKLKETKEDIDVVILGAEMGKGKRAGFYSSFLVAVKSGTDLSDEDEYLTIGKVSSGIKEIGSDGASMENLTRLLEPLKISENLDMIFFEPKIIIQVKYQEIQKSTSYESGYALRFPRIINLREDKTLDEINSVADVERFIS